ncbi:peptidylprolyl isomerase [Aeoliella sp. SH292]|uniref:peptidylprolyl isomerase n=1 Tax=Aeoliella sp. SH292 TaxID=3454464 RepID=UPI003F981942
MPTPLRRQRLRGVLQVVVMSFLALAAAAQVDCDAAQVTHRVRLYWDGGVAELDLFGEASPRHVANFLRYVDIGTYDGSYSHRSASGSAKFIQGGSFYYPQPFSPSAMHLYGMQSLFGQIKNEYDVSNGLTNSPGTIAAARTAALDSATVGWFINVTDNSSAFGNPASPYTVFGQVSTGMSSLNQLATLPTASAVFPGQVNSGVATAPIANFGTSSAPSWRPPIFYKWVRVPLVTGDFNLDGIVNAADQAVWTAGQGDFSTANLTADANGDGLVNNADLTIMQQNLGDGQLMNLPGDFNASGVVNAADYLWWKTQFGSATTLDSDGNGNGKVDLADYTVWRDNLGRSLPGTVLASTQVPEPKSIAMFVVLGSIAGLLYRAKKAGLE